jgi:anti-sigma factor ChrR (cupin superfamily)
MSLVTGFEPPDGAIDDTLYRTREMRWLEYVPGQAWIKIMWTGAAFGDWAVLFRWKKGFVAPAHKHLSGSHTYILSGKLEVRSGVLNAGDYIYEPNGAVHGATTALEDTEYLFVGNGPLLNFDADGNITGYFGWEQLERMRRRWSEDDPA